MKEKTLSNRKKGEEMEMGAEGRSKNFYLAALVIAVIVALAGHFIVQNVINLTPGRVFARYIECQRSRDYQKAYSWCFSRAYRENITYPDFVQLQENLARSLGFTINKEILATRVLKDKAGRKIFVVLALGFYPTGPAPENYFFTRSLMGWRIAGFDVRSPLADSAETARAEEFIKRLPSEVKESYERLLEAQGKT